MTTSGVDVFEARRAQMPLLGPGALTALQKKVVAIVGVGTLGGPLLKHFALLGIPLLLVDPDLVEAENLSSQLFCREDIGEPKVAVRARQARALNPALAVQTLVARVEDLGVARFGDVALIASPVDSFTSRVRINDIATKLGIPLLDVAVDGGAERALGIVSLYDPARGGPCMLCPASRMELSARLAREKPRGCPSIRDLGLPLSVPTLTGSAQAAVVAGFAAERALRVLLGRGDELAGTRLVVSGGEDPRIGTVRLARNAACLHDHRCCRPSARLGEAKVGAALAEAERRLAGSLEAQRDLHRTVTMVRFAARSFVVGLGCKCGAELDSVAAVGSRALDAIRCTRCGGHELAPRGVTDTLTGATLELVRERSWADLGVPSFDLVEMSTAKTSAWFGVARAEEA